MDCCKATNKQTQCKRADGKVFRLPRRFSKEKCTHGIIKGYSMKSSCAPYKFCKKSKTFLYNPDNPNKSFDVYINKNPNNTIPIKYSTMNDVRNTIRKLEKLYKSNTYTHKRIWQVGMILKVRLETIHKYRHTRYPKAKDVVPRYKLADRYFTFLKARTKAKTLKERKELKFKI